MTDKGPRFHAYTKPYYDAIMKTTSPQDVKLVGEIGIGFLGCMSHVSRNYRPGASLRMWKEFLPQATIIGFDIQPELFFQEDRIQCAFMDQGNIASMQGALAAPGRPFDLIVDDGSHFILHQLNTKEYAGDYLREGGLLIIEDIEHKYLMDRFQRPPNGFRVFDIGYTRNDMGNSYVIYQKLAGAVAATA